MNTPIWAEELIQEAIEYRGSKIKPVINWTEKDRTYTTGTARTPLKKGKEYIYKNRKVHCVKGCRAKISITAGTDMEDLKEGILHEVAHILSPPYTHHDRSFYRIAWDLFNHFELDLEKCLGREGRYKNIAKVEFNYLRKEGKL